MTIDFSIVGKRIQKIRKEKGLSQEQLAFMIGISHGHMCHIENGTRIPSIEMLINIAIAMDISIEEFLADLDYPRSRDKEIDDLISDCSEKEKRIFKELISFLKPALRNLRP